MKKLKTITRIAGIIFLVVGLLGMQLVFSSVSKDTVVTWGSLRVFIVFTYLVVIGLLMSRKR